MPEDACVWKPTCSPINGLCAPTEDAGHTPLLPDTPCSHTRAPRPAALSRGVTGPQTDRGAPDSFSPRQAVPRGGHAPDCVREAALSGPNLASASKLSPEKVCAGDTGVKATATHVAEPHPDPGLAVFNQLTTLGCFSELHPGQPGAARGAPSHPNAPVNFASG